MHDFLDKKITELTVLESVKYAYLISISTQITLTLDEFCKISGTNKRRVYQLLKIKYYPEKIIKGGYDSLKQRKSPIFITDEVLNWIKI